VTWQYVTLETVHGKHASDAAHLGLGCPPALCTLMAFLAVAHAPAGLTAFCAPSLAPMLMPRHVTTAQIRQRSFGVLMQSETENMLDPPPGELLPDVEKGSARQPDSPPIGSLVPVLILAALFTTNQWARQLPFYTVDFKAVVSDTAIFQFMNIDLGFDAAQYGVIASIGFSALFSITSLFAGGLVDRVDSRNLLTATAALWSGATVWQASAHSFNEVLASRMLSGVGQAFSNPASYTILGRIYPADRRATVSGIYSSGLYFGGGLAALSVLLDQQFGWRGAFGLVGVLGLSTAAVAQFLLPPVPPLVAAGTTPEEERELASAGSDDGEDRGEDGEALKPLAAEETSAPDFLPLLIELVSEPTVALLLLASTLRFLAGFTIGVWIVPFYRESFTIGAEFALIKAAVNVVAGSVSATGGGLLADSLAKRDPRFNQWVPAVGSLLAIPFWLGTLQAPTLELSLGALFLEYLFAEYARDRCPTLPIPPPARAQLPSIVRCRRPHTHHILPSHALHATLSRRLSQVLVWTDDCRAADGRAADCPGPDDRSLFLPHARRQPRSLCHWPRYQRRRVRVAPGTRVHGARALHCCCDGLRRCGAVGQGQVVERADQSAEVGKSQAASVRRRGASAPAAIEPRAVALS